MVTDDIKQPENESHLIKAAMEMGAERIPPDQDPFAGTSPIKDKLGDGKIHFHGELPKIEFKELVGQKFIIKEAMIVEGWDGFFGTSDFALLLIMLPDQRQLTTLAGGRAVIKQVRKLKIQKLLPVVVTLNQRPGQDGPYYIFE